jgi:tRNA-binding protein
MYFYGLGLGLVYNIGCILDKGKPMKTITYEDFESVELRSGTILKAEEFPRAKKPAYKIWADFGLEIGVLQTSAQVTVHYTPESLIGRQIVGCINLGERNIAGFWSQFLLVGFADENGAVCLIKPDPKVPNGKKLH